MSSKNVPTSDRVAYVSYGFSSLLIQDLSFVRYDNMLKGTEVRLGNLDRVDEKVQFMTRILQMEEEFGLKGTADLFYVDMRFQGTPVLKNRWF